jgi:hypothetical protein
MAGKRAFQKAQSDNVFGQRRKPSKMFVRLYVLRSNILQFVEIRQRRLGPRHQQVDDSIVVAAVLPHHAYL